MNRREALLARMTSLVDLAQAEQRDLTADEKTDYDAAKAEIALLDAAAKAKPAQPDPATLRRAPNPSAAVITKPREYSVIRAIGGIALNDPTVGDFGLEREIHQALSRDKAYKGVAVPINALFRKTAAGQDSLTSATGGALAITDQLMTQLLADVEGAILKNTILGPLGVQVLAVPNAQKIRVPLKKGRSTANWIARDGSGTVTDLQYDEIDAEPHSLVVAARLNRSALVYTPAQEGIVRQDLADSYVDAINDAFLNGLDASNQPLGLFKALSDASRDFTGDINANISLASIKEFQNTHVGAYAEAGPGRRWLAHPDFELAVTCSPVWAGALAPISDGATLGGYPMVTSFRAVDSGAGYAMFGDFAQTWMIQFGIALDLLGNVFADAVFMSGGMLIRGIADSDFVFRDLKRLALASDAQASASVPGP